MSDDLVFLTAAELAERYRAGSLSPLEVTEAHLARIERLEPTLNAYITVTAERARLRARAAGERYARGAPRGPLDGVPFAPKDIFATAGIPTTHGSRLGADAVPEQTATAVERLEAAGAVMLGKLNLLEYATGGGVDSGFGPTRNPWDTAYEPGGSSSGSGAAVAGGLATLSLGTDTGGSIRGPAGRCGIVGLKPTYGRVSVHGVTPLAWTLDHAGPMARTVLDTALVLGAVAGEDPRDPATAPDPVADYATAVRNAAPLAGRRFAVAPELMEPVEPEVAALVDAAIRHLEREGARRVEVRLPSAPAVNVATEVIIGGECAVFHEENMRRAERRLKVDPVVRLYVTSGRLYLATDYVKSQRLRLQLQAELAAALGDAEVLVCPTDPTLTPRLGAPVTLLGREMAWFEYGTYNLGNLTGAPALSLPCGFTREGLPVGLQLYGRPFDEAGLLGFARAYERSAGWSGRRPTL